MRRFGFFILVLAGCSTSAPRPPLPALATVVQPSFEEPPLAAIPEHSRRSPQFWAQQGTERQFIVLEHDASVGVAFLVMPSSAERHVEGMSVEIGAESVARRVPAGCATWSDSGRLFRAIMIRCPTETLGAGIAELSGFAREPVLETALFRIGSQTYLQSILDLAYSAPARTRIVARQTLYGAEDPKARDARTVLAALQSVKRSEVRDALEQLVSRSAIVVAGMIDAEDVDGLQLEPGSAAPRRLAVPDSTWTNTVREGAWDIGAFFTRSEQTYLRVLHHGPAPNSDDYWAFVLLAEVLTDAYTSPGAVLRHSQGASYGVRSELVQFGDATELSWGGYVENARALAALDAHQQSLRDILSGTVNAAALARAKRRAEVRELEMLTTAMGTARLYAERWAIGLDLTDPSSQLRAVAPEDLIEVARKYINAEALVVAIEGAPDYWTLNSRGEVETFQVIE